MSSTVNMSSRLSEEVGPTMPTTVPSSCTTGEPEGDQ